MSRRPWPDDRAPSADELVEWCRTGMTADVVPVLQKLLDDAETVARVRGLRDRWRETALYGNWSTTREYRNRVAQLDAALDNPIPKGDTP